MQEIRTKYRQHIATVLRLAGIADAEAKAERVFALELKLAQAHSTREDSEDVLKANNPTMPKSAGGVENTLGQATIYLAIFSVVGALIGQIAQATIDESVRAKLQQQLNQPAGKTVE